MTVPVAASVPSDLADRLARHGQTHLLAGWERLDDAARTRFAAELKAVDFGLIARLIATHRSEAGHAGDDPAAMAARATGPANPVRRPASEDDQAAWRRAAERGETALNAGKVGAVVVAGGQGTRLGFDKPKGMFPLGPVSGAPLFRMLAEQVLARGRRAGRAIPYYVMTSDATHAATVAFWEEEHYFGLNPDDVFFFSQGNMPAADAATGKLLLTEPGRLALSPDGHGGILAALGRSGAVADMARRGIELLHYHQVDNATAIVCDPATLGWHLERGSELTTKVVAKVAPEEKMGVVCDVDGITQIIEYSDLPAALADKRDAAGNPLFWAGNTAIHVFSRSLLERLSGTSGGAGLPFHLANKKVPYVDETGTLVNPTAPNAIKFERFIFDSLPLATNPLVVEADRSREFNPVKNATGPDSPATARTALEALGKSWLHAAGATVAENATIEISPLFALDAEEVQAKVPAGTQYEGAVRLG